ncbi:sensor histidine kinase [Hyalangium versicolor]|uniref:sensor histidine kinase n=1 Tax=Hyalangium versicolor TaxID=2861190 RepID=UPI001CD03B19|nr:HAMP domain-containing sensor histidine kinase [Hyalangium versicolor]
MKVPSLKRTPRLRAVLVTLAFLAGLIAEWTLVSWLKAAALAALGVQLSPYISQVIDLVVSLVLFGFIMKFIGKAFFNWRMTIFTVLNDALSRIARGDFSVSVPVEEADDDIRENPVLKVAVNINQVAEALQRMEAMRQEFISNVSHEIQSPLTSIRGFAQALREGGLSEETRQHYLTTIEAESRRLSRLSENLLRLSSLDSKAHAPVPRRYRLDSQLREVVLAAEPQWTAKGLDIEADLDAVYQTADEDMLNQVWTNLVHNAIKFTPTGGKIGIELRLEDKQALVRLTDSGIGISPEDLPFVFDRFYKADKARSRTDTSGGSGLGLAIARKIVELHGGRIEALSEGLGKGSCFAVRLPSAEPYLKAPEPASPDTSSELGAEQGAQPDTVQSARWRLDG